MTKRLIARPSIVGIVVSVLITAGWYQFLWSPQTKAIATAHSRQKVATAALFSAEQRLGHLKKLALHAGDLTSLDQRLSAAIPDHDALDQFIVQLNADAQASNVVLSSFAVTQPSIKAPANAAVAAGTEVLALQLAVSGGYFDVLRFLGSLRDGPRLVIVDQLSLTPAHGGGSPADGTTVGASIVGRLFMTTSAAPPVTFRVPVTTSPAPKPGTGVLETPINAARNAANAASASAASASAAASAGSAGGTP
jgi:Tfp pilus assembly protein PilO